MLFRNIPHYTDSNLTQAKASLPLEDQKITLTCYINRASKHSVVHAHPYYFEMVLVLNGTTHYSADGDLFDVHVGETIIFPANCHHAGNYGPTSEVSERLIIQIDIDFWNKILRQSGLEDPVWCKSPTVLDADASSQWELRALFQSMALTADMECKHRETMFGAQLMALMLIIHQIVADQHVVTPTASNALISKVTAYIHENFRDPELDVQKLAQISFVSREHLSRLFKKYTLESAHSYLTNLRMAHCRRQIINGKSILDACTESGFSNYSSFLKTFRKLYGITPMEYRSHVNNVLERSPSSRWDPQDIPI